LIWEFVIFTYVISYYIAFAYKNRDKLLSKIIDVLVTILLVAIIVYAIINTRIGIILGIVCGVCIATKFILDGKIESKSNNNKQIRKEDFILNIKKYSNEIEKGKYTANFQNGGYNYSTNIKYVIDIINNIDIPLNDTNINKKELLTKDIETFSLKECIEYFNYVWHLESSAKVGIVKKEVESKRYVLVMNKLINYFK